MIWAETDLITTIDHYTSTKKGPLSNLLMINDKGQNRPYYKKISPHINHTRSIIKFTKD